MSEETYYDLLGIDRSAGVKEIRDAYRRISKRVHPDSGGTSGLFRQIQDAHETLTDPKRRAEYDHRLDQATDVDSDKYSGNDYFYENTSPGWERVDTPGNAPSNGYRQNNGHQDEKGNQGNNEDAKHVWEYGYDSNTNQGIDGGTNWRKINQFFNVHPAGSLTILGMVLVLLSTDLPGLPGNVNLIGTLLVILGLLSMFGKWRISRRRPVYLHGWRLFGAGLKEGARSILYVVFFVAKLASKS